MKALFKEIRISLVATFSLAVILCGIYPFSVWVIAQGVFPSKANGSLITQEGKAIGSRLISQGFSGPRYFHPRPSAAGQGTDVLRSGGSNLGPTSKTLVEVVRLRIMQYRTENGLPADALVPADAATASASGLDPHISLKNAVIQCRRVGRVRGLSKPTLDNLVKAHTEGRFLGVIGEPRVNVLTLNLALDEYDRKNHDRR